MILHEDAEVVVAPMAVNRESGRAGLLGFSPEAERWILDEDWDWEDLDQRSFYELLERWEAEMFVGREERVIG